MNDGKCGTCRHWELIEYECEDGLVEIVVADGFDVGQCQAQTVKGVIVGVGKIPDFRQPVTAANWTCSKYAPLPRIK